VNKLEDLHKLVKSMSKSEKGYFKKFVAGFSAAADNNYLVLFDLLDKSEQLQPQKIEKHFAAAGKKINLRALKAYLYQLLLKSLRLYHEKNNYRFEATNLINEIEILLDKGFEQEAYSLSQEGTALCRRYELRELELIFLKYEHHTFGDKILWEDLPLVRQRLRNELIANTRQLEYCTEIRHIELSVIYLANTYFPTAEKGPLKELEKLVQHPLLQSADKIVAFEALLAFYNVWRVYYSLTGQKKKALQYAAEIPLLIENRQCINKTFIGRYVRGVLNQAKLTIDTGQPAAAWILLEKLKNIPTESPGDARWLEVTHIAGIIHFLKTYADYLPQGRKIAGVMEQKLLNSGLFEGTYKLSLLYNLSTFYFHAGDYSHTLDILNIILNRKPGGNHAMFVHARLLQIIIHYELGNKLLLPSLIKSTFRLMARAELQFEFERIVLRFFTRVLRPSNHVVLKNELKYMMAEVRKISNNEYEKQPLGMFDYIGWLEKKIKTN
jgi:hypothetical protein